MRRRKAEIIEWLRRQRPARAGEELACRLKDEFPGVSSATLRRALIESGLELDPLVEGVRQDSLHNLERTLLALAAGYEAGGAERRAQVRGLVRTARQHAVFASRSKPKEEELLWLKTWLENPLVFAEWLKLRKRACGAGRDEL